MKKKLPGWFSVALLLLSQLAPAQSNPPARAKSAPASNGATTSKKPTLADYQALLSDPDIAGDPDIVKAIYAKWVDLTCKAKQTELAAIGINDQVMSKEVYTSCSARLLAQDPTAVIKAPSTVKPAGTPPSQPSTPPTAATAATALTQDQMNQLDAAVAALVVPAGCSLPPSPSKSIAPDLQSSIDRSPIQMSIANVPKGWLYLSPNSSGGEHYTKSTVWVGYVNRLRYAATLGGVVTVIAAPALPNNIFPSPAVAPAAKPAPSGQGAPLASPSTNNFNQLNQCIDNIQKETVTFQQYLAGYETVLNSARIRIQTRLSTLTPIASSAAEARSAADLTMFPDKTVPTFPLADVIALRGLLTEVMTEYSQIAQWAGTSPDVKNIYAAENASGTATGKALDVYLAQPGVSNSAKQSASNPPTGGPGPNGTAQPAPQVSSQPGSTTLTSKSSPVGGGGQNTLTTQPQSDSCSSHLDSVSQEVNDYEDNRCYIDSWRNTFRNVAGANDLYFVASYAPTCGGWFGQGTSTQMQLTISDSTQPGATASPITLDKIVCQPPLTVSNGIGLSFVASHVPAFVPGVAKDSSGNPVVGSNGNPTIIQTLGYSSTAPVNPSYSVIMNVALLPLKGLGIELHWATGAMLTAATSGTTTDILTGPAISFRKRAFFISPVYDLGLRTDYQAGFAIGMPQGNLTSPPTSQNWRSGFGLTITFPLTQSSTNQTTSGGATGTPGTAEPQSGSTPGTATKKPSTTSNPAN